MNQFEKIRSDLQTLKPELSRRFFVDKIGLFGSVTRNDFSDSSDIDILVNFTRTVGIEFIDLGNFLEQWFQRKVDLVSMEGIKPGFLAEIQKQIVYV